MRLINYTMTNTHTYGTIALIGDVSLPQIFFFFILKRYCIEGFALFLTQDVIRIWCTLKVLKCPNASEISNVKCTCMSTDDLQIATIDHHAPTITIMFVWFEPIICREMTK